MGIQNLLRFMKPFIEAINIKKYSGKRVGIDAYSWLHKGAYSCSMELCLNSNCDKSSRYLHYFMHRINLLRHFKITPVVVFDGGSIPCKSATENDRKMKRDANLAMAKKKLDQGDISEAVKFFQGAVSITPSMAYQLIQILRSENIEYIVAPYEADAQLAYLSNLKEENGGVAAVITEDSDLMAYGCQAIIFKMDRYGNGEEIVLDKVFNSDSGEPSFKYFDKEMFLGMCVLAGCDFLPSVPGIGIKRAYSLVSKYKNLDRALSMLKFERGHQMPEDYSKSFKEAIAVFHHARIFDTETKTLKPMKPLPEKLLQSLDEDLDFLGPNKSREMSPSIAAAIAEGRLDPITMEAFNVFPKVEFHLDPKVIHDFDHFPIAERQVTSTEESCFTIISAHDREEKITVMKENLTFDDKKYLNEAVALGKLVAPLELPQKLENIVEERVEFPHNNPFKKIKLKEYTSKQGESTTEQDSAFEKLVAPLELPQKLENTVEERVEFPNNNPFKTIKLEECTSKQEESTTEQASVVIDVGNSDEILCSTPESQKSVNSKPTKRAALSKVKNEKKSRIQNNCKSLESGSSSILNFFTRL